MHPIFENLPLMPTPSDVERPNSVRKHKRGGACLGIKHAIVYCTYASRGLSATADFPPLIFGSESWIVQDKNTYIEIKVNRY